MEISPNTEDMDSVTLWANITTVDIIFDKSANDYQKINQTVDVLFLIFLIPICVVTFVTNTWAIIAIQENKDQLVIKSIIILDCVGNMVFAAMGTFEQVR